MASSAARPDIKLKYGEKAEKNKGRARNSKETKKQGGRGEC